MRFTKSTGYVMAVKEEEKKDFLKHIILKNEMLDDIKRANAIYYKFVCEPEACDICINMHGLAYPVSDAREGINFPPLHPNCRCDAVPYSFEDDLLSSFPYGNPGNWTPNDWRFYGRTGDEFESQPDVIYTDDYFGKAIDPKDYQNLHILDWLARLLFHETSDPNGQAAIAWTIFNRIEIGNGFTASTNTPHTLMNVLNAPKQYHAYEEAENRNPAQPNFFHPIDYINSLPSPYKEQQQASWDNALRLAKLLVSVYGNPNLDQDSKKAFFETAIPNPFSETQDGEKVNPNIITYYLAYETDRLPFHVGGNWFGYDQRQL